MTESDVLRRVRGLLDKAESTTSEHERNACVAKAQQLMLNHAIDEAMVEAARAGHNKPRQLPTSKTIVYTEGKGYHRAKQDLLMAVCYENRCKVVFYTKPQSASDKRRSAVIVGFADDIAFCEMLYTSLWLQLMSAGMKAHETAEAEWSDEKWDYVHPHRKSFISAFAQGFISKVRSRMRENNKQATTDAGSRALVLADRRDEVQAEFDKLFPSTKNLGRSQNRGSAAAWGAGSRAGERANLGQSSLPRQTALPGR